MKPFVIAVIFLLPFTADAQLWESYQISVKGDTINCVDREKMKQGKWVLRVESLRGEPGYEEEGEFVDDKKEGPWRRYNLTGDILAMESYRWGFRDGKQTYFTSMGDLLREESWKAVNPLDPYDTIEVPDMNNPMVTTSKIIKHEASEIKHGPWKFYDPSSGMIKKSENYTYGQRLDGMGKPIAEGTTPATKPMGADDKPKAKPAAVEEWEKKNEGKKKVAVRDGRTGG
jgi:antitoxin component YwqK of YwqJK toxin-antitoxin module